MKRSLSVLFFAFLACAAVAASANVTLTPCPRAGGKHQSIKAAYAKAGPGPVLLLGDSLTDNWRGKAFENLRAKLGNMVNAGICGDRIEQVLWRFNDMSELVKTNPPSAVTIMIGTNNLGRDHLTAEDVYAGISNLVGVVRTTAPEAKIVLFAIPPRAIPYVKRPLPYIATVNKLARGLGDCEHVFWFDFSAHLLDPETGKLWMPAYAGDCTHFTDRGYAEVLEPYFVGAVRLVLSERTPKNFFRLNEMWRRHLEASRAENERIMNTELYLRYDYHLSALPAYWLETFRAVARDSGCVPLMPEEYRRQAREEGLPSALTALTPMPKRGLCAHRGDRSAFPENTVIGFEHAVAKGAAMVEFDVWRCKTGELVVMHDATVNRTTTGTGFVERLSFEYLRSLDAGVKKDPAFAGTKIPTFDEAVDCFPKSGVWLNIHCKAGACDEVARKLKAKGRLHQAFVASADKGVQEARAAVPEVKTCLMTGPWRPWKDGELTDYVTLAITNRYDFAQPHCCALTPPEAKRFRDAGGRFTYFWLSDPEKLPGLMSTGVDFPLVDDLDGMLATWRAWEKAGCPKADYAPEFAYDGDEVSGNDMPSLAGTAWIEREIAGACARSDALQAKLTDRVSVKAYREFVPAVNGTNVWTAALQKALDEHEIVTIPASAEPYYIDAPVLVPSNRRIEAEGATIALMTGTRTLMLRNKNAQDGTLAPIARGARDRNIAIVGGTWTDWKTSRAGYGNTGMFNLQERKHGNFFGVSTLFFFNNCDHVSVTDATFRRCSAFAVQAGDGNAHRYARIRFDDCFADGLHLNGNLTRVLCKDVRGKVGDDLVALNAYDWLNSSVDFGPQSLILCEDLELQLKDGKGYPAIRIQPAKYRYTPSNVVDCVISDVIFRRVKGIKTFKMYLQTPPYEIGGAREWAEVGTGGNLHFEDMEIDLESPIDHIGQYMTSDPVRGHFGAFEFGANLTSVTFKNVDVTFHADKWPMTHLATVGPKSCRNGNWEIFDPYVDCTVKRVVLDGLRVHGVSPKDLVYPVTFDDINKDGVSSGRGRILRTVFRRRAESGALRPKPAKGVDAVVARRHLYAPWTTNAVRTVEAFADAARAANPACDAFGGWMGTGTGQVGGFFRVRKIDGRWWFVDPLGNLFLSQGVASFSPGNSGRSESTRKAFEERWRSDYTRWINDEVAFLKTCGFNSLGAWSRVRSPADATNRIPYTVIFHPLKGRPKPYGLSSVSDTNFLAAAEEEISRAAEFRDDPYCLGYFIGNEYPLSPEALDVYLGHVARLLRKYDPNHLFLGCRFSLPAIRKEIEATFRVAGRHCDVVSVNHYGRWEPSQDEMRDWEAWSGRPFMITEFYVKGEDSGLPNRSGAGWRVRTQEDRGLFYENFTLGLLRAKGCVGWHWFKYMDNDPEDDAADRSNRDSNKGIVRRDYTRYEPLVEHMKRVNNCSYSLIRIFDGS